MEATPRYSEIVLVLRALLAKPGVGPHLSRYWQHCGAREVPLRNAHGEEQYADVDGLRLLRIVVLPEASQFLELLYLIELGREPDQGQTRGALTGIGRQAFYNLMGQYGPPVVKHAQGLETFSMWEPRLPGPHARDFPEHLQVVLGIAEHYLASQLSEEIHRACVPAEVLAQLPWDEVTVPWLLATEEVDPWYRRRDAETIALIAELITMSFGFDERLATAFWDMADVGALFEHAHPDWRQSFLNRMRKEKSTLSNKVLAQIFPLTAVVELAPVERIDYFLSVFWQWLGGSEFGEDEERHRAQHQPSAPTHTGALPPPLPAAAALDAADRAR